MTYEQKEELIKEFIFFCQEELGIEYLPDITLTDDRNWAVERKSFGQYSPEEKSLIIYIGSRNLADILRTLGHELVHHRQHELGRIKGMQDGKSGSPIENEANAVAGILMRNFGKGHDMIYESCLPTLKEIVEVENAEKIQIYCDMDGVLCDFDGRFEYYYGVLPTKYYRTKGIKAFEQAVNEAGPDFWAKMSWMPGGKELWSIIGKYNPIILTGIGRFLYAVEGKTRWINTHLNPLPKDAIFGQTGRKHIAIPKSAFIKEKSILIDDYWPNLEPWKQSGGVSVIHKNIGETIEILKKLGIK